MVQVLREQCCACWSLLRHTVACPRHVNDTLSRWAQVSLRPILHHLAYYNKLKLPLLKGLARLLTLFSNWFNVTLGALIHSSSMQWLRAELR